MANELLIPGRGVVHAKVESTYGTDATPGASDVVQVYDFEAAYQQDEITRDNVTQPHVNGLMSEHGAGHVSWSCSVAIDMQAITSADSVTDADAGSADWAFRCCGFSRHDDDADASMAYALRDSTHESATIYAYEADQDDSIANLMKIVGARADWSLALDPGSKMMLNLSGGLGVAQALGSTAGQETDSIINETSALEWTAASAVTYPSDDCFLSHNATVRFIANGAIVGGGSIGSPNNELLVRSCTINGNMAPTEAMGISGNQGAARIDLRPTTSPTVDLVIEATTLDDFNPYQLRAAKAPVELNLTYTQPGGGNSGNTLQIVMFGQIVGTIDKSENGGSLTYGLTLALRYPGTAAAPLTTVGTQPANTIVNDSSGSARGVDYDPASAYPATKLLLQFKTT